MQKLPKFVSKQATGLAGANGDKSNKLEKVITLKYFLMSGMFFSYIYKTPFYT